MKTVAIIPARGNSKGVPRKNLREICGRPLLVHSIEHAIEASVVDEVYVSTDNTEIAEVAIAAGAEVIKRPAVLALDASSSEAALEHALDQIMARLGNLELIVFLQATSPIRRAIDIDAAVARLKEESADSLLSVSASHRFLWQLDSDGAHSINYDYRQRPRRQDMAPQYVENGSIYVFKPQVLRETGNRLGGRIALYEMSEAAAMEIDTEQDFKLVEFLLAGGDQQ